MSAKFKFKDRPLTWKQDTAQLVKWGYTPCGNCVHWRAWLNTRSRDSEAKGECDIGHASVTKDHNEACLFGYSSLEKRIEDLESLGVELSQ